MVQLLQHQSSMCIHLESMEVLRAQISTFIISSLKDNEFQGREDTGDE